MTLRELILRHPDQFYPQTWYLGEAFLDTPLPGGGRMDLPYRVVSCATPGQFSSPPLAVHLAALYVRHPADPLWRHYLWCADTDAQGQRVYVGANGHGFEIHRHLHLTERWGIPVWS